ncbi:MAG: Hsp20/alpha crystallin family protein [Desulfocapsaceae bacterium]|nr:Hsp20/alpha crystallin family protein [Desulfocapsaceae bacterium]
MSERSDISKVEESMPDRRRSELPTITPLVDIYENDEEILLHADMPGINKDDININIDNGRLVLSGIRRLEKTGAASWEEFGDAEYRRIFSVPQTIDTTRVNAELKDGVLKLKMPKFEKAKPRQIEIKAG